MRAGEGARRAVHLATGGLALLLRHLTPTQAAGAAAGALLFNLFLLPRLAPGLFRGDERRHPWRSGIILYPAAVFLLIVLFRDRMEVAAAAWVIMASGDAAAGWIGARFGRQRLPWNRGKSWAGSAAFAIAAGPAAAGILVWMGVGAAGAAALGAAAALFAAGIESLPWRLNDNLTVPILAGLFLRGLVEVDARRLSAAGPGFRDAFLQGAAVSLALAFLAHRAGSVDRSGAGAGFLVGACTYTFGGWRSFLVLLTFFVLGSAATRIGWRRKVGAGVAQGKRGARSARHALANCGVAVYLAFVAAGSPEAGLFGLAFVCAYATAAFDTISSEIGQAWGGRPVLITTLRAVPIGTDGAISWLGTLAGAAAAAAVAAVAGAIGLLPDGLNGLVILAAFIGSTADSYLGATLEAKGLMDNEAVNFSNTLVGALAGIGLAVLTSAPV